MVRLCVLYCDRPLPLLCLCLIRICVVVFLLLRADGRHLRRPDHRNHEHKLGRVEAAGTHCRKPGGEWCLRSSCSCSCSCYVKMRTLLTTCLPACPPVCMPGETIVARYQRRGRPRAGRRAAVGRRSAYQRHGRPARNAPTRATPRRARARKREGGRRAVVIVVVIVVRRAAVVVVIVGEEKVLCFVPYIPTSGFSKTFFPNKNNNKEKFPPPSTPLIFNNVGYLHHGHFLF